MFQLQFTEKRLLFLKRALFLASIGAGLIFFAACQKAESQPVSVKETKEGLASFYGKGFQGKETASGETFKKQQMIAAHPSYPLGTTVRVINLENDRNAEVRIIDRGPTSENQAEGVIIDLSEGAAKQIGLLKDGRARVKVEVLEWGSGDSK